MNIHLPHNPVEPLKNQNGQSFIEFILLFCIMVIFAFAMLKGFNGSVADRWKSLVQTIARPSSSTIELR